MNYLPLGSVISLKNLDEKILIIGVNQVSLDEKEKIYDYCGCVHPYGFINNNSLLLFNNDQVDKVYHTGYEDEDLKDYYEDLVWLKSNKKEKDNNEK